MVLTEDLNEEFGNFCINVEKSVLDKAAELCGEYGVSPEEFVYGWVAYSAAERRCPPSVQRLEAMARAKLATQRRRSSTNTVSAPQSAKMPRIYNKDSIDQFVADKQSPVTTRTQSRIGGSVRPVDECGAVVEALPGATPFSPASYSPSAAVSSARYSSRVGRGDVVSSYGTTTSCVATTTDHVAVTCHVAATWRRLARAPYRYMFDTLWERATLLAEHIMWLGERVRVTAQVEHESVAQPHALSQEPVYVVGRVGSDSGGRMNPHSVVLHAGCGRYGGARSVALDVSRATDCALFPGQVVMAHGVNPTGDIFYASSIYSSALPRALPPPQLSRDVTLMCVCGPFTTAEDLQYDPLKDVLALVSKRRPDVLLLQGPFIDQKIVDNELAETYDQLWARLIQLISSAVSDCHTRVLLQCSSSDIHGEPVTPQPALSLPSSTRSDALLSLPNPCCVNVCEQPELSSEEASRDEPDDDEDEREDDGDEETDHQPIMIAAFSTDVLMHLSQQELKILNVRPGADVSDRLSRLAGYLLHQRCFYPLYPPTCGPPGGVGIDWQHWHTHCTIKRRPHLLILPSEFRGFIKEVEGTIVVNPSRLVRGVSGGTCAVITVSAGDSTGPPLKHRVSAQIIKV